MLPSTTVAVVVADGGRARFFELELSAPGRTRLTQVGDTANPEHRQRISEVVSETRPGLRQQGPGGPRHGVSDRRDHYREMALRRFVKEASEEAIRLWTAQRPDRIILVAPSDVLSGLRRGAARFASQHATVEIFELDRDLIWMTPAVLQEALDEADLLPSS